MVQPFLIESKNVQKNNLVSTKESSFLLSSWKVLGEDLYLTLLYKFKLFKFLGEGLSRFFDSLTYQSQLNFNCLWSINLPILFCKPHLVGSVLIARIPGAVSVGVVLAFNSKGDGVRGVGVFSSEVVVF